MVVLFKSKYLKTLKSFFGPEFQFKSSYTVLFLVIICSFTFNLYIGDKIKYETGGDAAEFIELGVSLSKNGQFSFLDNKDGNIIKLFKENRVKEQDLEFARSNTWRPPVWPILISAIFFLFGYNLSYLLLFKLFLHVLGTLIFYKILDLYDFSKKLIFTGTALYALNPASQLYSRTFLSEPVTFFLLTLWLYFLIRHLKRNTSFLPQALIGGILILSHPYSIFFPFFFLFFLVFEQNL